MKHSEAGDYRHESGEPSAQTPHMNDVSIAFGAPGMSPRWTSSAKDGVGTAYHSGSNVWFTISHGILNEIYFPHVDTPNTRDLQFLITDGESFCHEERRDLEHVTEYPEQDVLLCRITNSEREGRYRLVKEVIADPHLPVVLMHTRVEILDEKLQGKLRLYALLAPHVKGTGYGNSAWKCNVGGRKLIEIRRADLDVSFGCSPDFLRRSTGFVGYSDGWRDLMDNFQMDWEFEIAENGNIAVLGEVDLSQGLEFTMGVGFGHTPHSACTHLQQSLGTPFADHRAKFVRQWQRACAEIDLSAFTNDGGSMLRLSKCVLLAHEDKQFQGAFVASLSVPWGNTKDDSDRGGYHLVWTRDMVQTATALLAYGHTEAPLRALIWLACIQSADGRLPQNSSIDGEPYWKGLQLDEIAAPILLAWRLKRAKALRQFDPWTLVSRAVRYVILHGPVTAQERWEENGGYSPSTIATLIAGLICVSEFADERGADVAAEFLREYADWLVSHLEDWMVTNCGELVHGTPRHYIRITPPGPTSEIADANPDEAEIFIANGGGRHAARNIVGGDFLHLVRLGVRTADDPLIKDSVSVMDQVIRHDLPQGPCWRRYNHDGYGQKSDGSAYDGTGVGRCWPILTGERGHYELAAGNDPAPFIAAMEQFANAGGMLPEQVWDAEDLEGGKIKRGGPTGAAMPLCWSHAEYVSLVRSRRDGVCFDRIDPVHQRYAVQKTASHVEMWTLAHQIRWIMHGRRLRIITGAVATVRWSFDQWATVSDTELRCTGIGCWFADLPNEKLPPETDIVFTLQWADRWVGRDFRVSISRSA